MPLCNHRKLLLKQIVSNDFPTCPPNCGQSCTPGCIKFFPPPPPPYYSPYPTVSNVLIQEISLGVIIFLFVCCAIISKFCIRWRWIQSPQLESNINDLQHREFHAPTEGLQQSVIDSIAVFKYSNEEQRVAIDGANRIECAVCLNEFKKDETLRLLPKCDHAFHITCIDAWLQSHVTCPLCRGCIVANTLVTDSTSNQNHTIGDQVE